MIQFILGFVLGFILGGIMTFITLLSFGNELNMILKLIKIKINEGIGNDNK